MLVKYDTILIEENRKMARRNYTAEQIIIKLRKIELLCNQGNTIAEAVRKEEITEQTYYRWRKKTSMEHQPNL